MKVKRMMVAFAMILSGLTAVMAKDIRTAVKCHKCIARIANVR